MIDFRLKVTTPNNEYRKLIGKEKFARVTKETCMMYDNTCQCCGWKPLEEEGENESQFDYKKKHLVLHVDSINKEAPIDSDVTLLCRSCYVINHIDIGIEHGWVKLVNSRLSQKDLIRICWNDISRNQVIGNNLSKAKNDRAYMEIKKDPLIFLEEVKDDFENENLNMVKVVFTDTFLKK